MDNQPWDSAKLADWKRMWESDMGKEAIAKFQSIREYYIDSSLGQTNPDVITALVGRAAGVDAVLQDIQTGIDAANKAAEKEGKATKK